MSQNLKIEIPPLVYVAYDYAKDKGYAEKFCTEQCEEGPGWGECQECGCNLVSIRETLTGLKEAMKK